MRAALALLALALVAAAAAAASPAAEPDVVRLSTGLVSGVRDAAANVRYWRGVPFAESTAGANRFAPPVPKAPWTGVRNATEFGHGCYSTRSNPDSAQDPSEDCLNVNVYAPLNATTRAGAKPLPVIVWIYGGSFAEGDNVGAFGMYNAAWNAANKDVVYVELNYRLSLFGFLVVDDLQGNYGIQDQQLALRWVQKNAAAFGGDPAQVTIQGESAGAMSVGLHLVAPGSKGLFKRAILESNPLGLAYNTNAHMSQYGTTACKEMGCAAASGSCNLTCARSVPPKTVIEAADKAGSNVIDYLRANWGHLLDGFLPFKPTVDGTVIPDNVIPALAAAGNRLDVDVLVGTNTNEAETFLMGGKKAVPVWQADVALALVFGKDLTPTVMDYYGEHYNFTDGRLLLSRVLTHYWFRCASEKFATAAAGGGKNSFVYRYDHVFSDKNLFSTFGFPEFCGDAVCHATELPMVFHFVDIETPKANATMTPGEVQLSQNMVSYWTNFAKTGNPNAASLPAWPTWSAETRNNLVLDETTSVESSFDLCASLWDKIGYNH